LKIRAIRDLKTKELIRKIRQQRKFFIKRAATLMDEKQEMILAAVQEPLRHNYKTII
tara:strand:+ start:1214 stop:1384 length:171 start_codon:yes stop_codon:yes gene_type:complete